MAAEPAQPSLVIADGSMAVAWANEVAAWVAWAEGEMADYAARVSPPVSPTNPGVAPATPAGDVDFTTLTLSSRAGVADPGRSVTHLVFHTAEWPGVAAEGTARQVAWWQHTQTDWFNGAQRNTGPSSPGMGWQPVYSGYHHVIDEHETVTYADPLTERAYGAATPGWNRVSAHIAVACRATDWATMPASRRARIISRIRALTDRSYGGVPVVRTTSLTRAGWAGHGDIQPNRTDPGAGFPWAEIMLPLEV